MDIKFKCKIIKDRFIKDDYKVYVVDVDKSIYNNIKCNKNGEYIIFGNFQTLVLNNIYEVVAELDVHKTFGYQYKIKDIRADKPTDISTSKNFLYEIITPTQADILLSVYPNIIDKIIKNDLSDIDLNKTKGIKQATFDKIKNKIIENFALIDIVDLFKGAITISMANKLYEKYTSIEKIKTSLKTNPYRSLCDISRVGFKTADSIILNIESQNVFKFNINNIRTSIERMRSCVEFILQENETTGNTKISAIELRKLCYKLTPECISKFMDVLKESNTKIHIDNKDKSISTSLAYDTELYISDTIKELLKQHIAWNINSELFRNIGEYPMTNEQLSTIDSVCHNGITLLTACGGAGKSTSVYALLQALKEQNKTYMLCTPTGASSEVLSDYTKEDAGTIHRKLGFNPSDGWNYNKDNKLDVDIVICDEFGMVDIYLMKHLLDAIDISKTKLLLVFDPYQLSSVGCGNIAQDLLSSKVIPTVFLTKIFRYGEGGLMKVATHIRNSEQFLDNHCDKVNIFGTKKDFIFNEILQSKLIHQVKSIYMKLLKDGYKLQDIAILSSQNKGEYGTKTINKEIQYELQKNKKNKFMMRGEDKFYKGDKIIQVVNNYKAKTLYGDENESIFNGNTGVISEVYWDYMIVDFKDKQIKYEKTDLDQIELGYCISIHKSQGSSLKQVIIVAPKAHTFMLNSNLLYVACTRARERAFLIGNIITINRAIKKKENLERNTYLGSMLLEND